MHWVVVIPPNWEQFERYDTKELERKALGLAVEAEEMSLKATREYRHRQVSSHLGL